MGCICTRRENAVICKNNVNPDLSQLDAVPCEYFQIGARNNLMAINNGTPIGITGEITFENQSVESNVGRTFWLPPCLLRHSSDAQTTIHTTVALLYVGIVGLTPFIDSLDSNRIEAISTFLSDVIQATQQFNAELLSFCGTGLLLCWDQSLYEEDMQEITSTSPCGSLLSALKCALHLHQNNPHVINYQHSKMSHLTLSTALGFGSACFQVPWGTLPAYIITGRPMIQIWEQLQNKYPGVVLPTELHCLVASHCNSSLLSSGKMHRIHAVNYNPSAISLPPTKWEDFAFHPLLMSDITRPKGLTFALQNNTNAVAKLATVLTVSLVGDEDTTDLEQELVQAAIMLCDHEMELLGVWPSKAGVSICAVLYYQNDVGDCVNEAIDVCIQITRTCKCTPTFGIASGTVYATVVTLPSGQQTLIAGGYPVHCSLLLSRNQVPLIWCDEISAEACNTYGNYEVKATDNVYGKNDINGRRTQIQLFTISPHLQLRSGRSTRTITNTYMQEISRHLKDRSSCPMGQREVLGAINAGIRYSLTLADFPRRLVCKASKGMGKRSLVHSLQAKWSVFPFLSIECREQNYTLGTMRQLLAHLLAWMRCADEAKYIDMQKAEALLQHLQTFCLDQVIDDDSLRNVVVDGKVNQLQAETLHILKDLHSHLPAIIICILNAQFIDNASQSILNDIQDWAIDQNMRYCLILFVDPLVCDVNRVACGHRSLEIKLRNCTHNELREYVVKSFDRTHPGLVVSQQVQDFVSHYSGRQPSIAKDIVHRLSTIPNALQLSQDLQLTVSTEITDDEWKYSKSVHGLVWRVLNYLTPLQQTVLGTVAVALLPDKAVAYLPLIQSVFHESEHEEVTNTLLALVEKEILENKIVNRPLIKEWTQGYRLFFPGMANILLRKVSEKKITHICKRFALYLEKHKTDVITTRINLSLWATYAKTGGLSSLAATVNAMLLKTPTFPISRSFSSRHSHEESSLSSPIFNGCASVSADDNTLTNIANYVPAALRKSSFKRNIRRSHVKFATGFLEVDVILRQWMSDNEDNQVALATSWNKLKSLLGLLADTLRFPSIPDISSYLNMQVSALDLSNLAEALSRVFHSISSDAVDCILLGPELPSIIETHIEILDGQSKQILDITEKLRSMLEMSESSREDQLLGVMTQALEYLCYHFYSEESVMFWTQFPKIAQHKEIHQAFIDKAFDIMAQLKSNQRGVFDEFVIWMYQLRVHLSVTDSQWASNLGETYYGPQEWISKISEESAIKHESGSLASDRQSIFSNSSSSHRHTPFASSVSPSLSDGRFPAIDEREETSAIAT